MDVVCAGLEYCRQDILERVEIAQSEGNALLHPVSEKDALASVVPVPRLDAQIVGANQILGDSCIRGHPDYARHANVVLSLGRRQVEVISFHAQCQHHLVGHHPDVGVACHRNAPVLLSVSVRHRGHAQGPPQA